MDNNSIKNKVDFLWDVLKRYDHYIATTNVKASLLLGFLGMVIFGVVLRLSLLKFEQSCFVILFLVVSAFLLICCVYICWQLINVVLPNTSSGKGSDSAIFFGDVANLKNKNSYYEKIQESTEQTLQKDLAEQVYFVAKVADEKFKQLAQASQIVKYGVLPLLIAFIVIYILTIGLK